MKLLKKLPIKLALATGVTVGFGVPWTFYALVFSDDAIGLVARGREVPLWLKCIVKLAMALALATVVVARDPTAGFVKWLCFYSFCCSDDFIALGAEVADKVRQSRRYKLFLEE
jgi:hypothetical protein